MADLPAVSLDSDQHFWGFILLVLSQCLLKATRAFAGGAEGGGLGRDVPVFIRVKKLF